MKPVYVRKLALIAAVVLVPAISQAQGYVNCGVRAGGSLLRMGGDATRGTDVRSQTGFCAGALLEIGITGNIAIQPEAFYTRKGTKSRYLINDGVKDGTVEETNELSYIEFPVLVKLRIPTSGKIVPSLFAGPAIAVNIGGTSTGTDVEGILFPWEGPYGWDGDIANLKSLDFSGIVGAGLGVPIGRLTLLLDLRYDFSFASAVREIDNFGTPSYDPGDKIPLVSNEKGAAKDLRNRAASISAALTLPL